MTQKPNQRKPGLFRRIMAFIGKFFRFLRMLVNSLLLLLVIALIGSLFFERIQPLPSKAFLRVAPSGVLVEQLSYVEPLAQLLRRNEKRDAETSVHDLVEAIDAAIGDDRITGISLELDYLDRGGISKLEEIGAALERFRASGKPVIAVGNGYSQHQYYLASFASEIHLNPMGEVLLTGYSAYRPFFRDALDKLRVKVNVFRAGQYKDAVEPFTRNDMSAASREHTASWINALWQTYVSRVEALRRLPPQSIGDYVDHRDTLLAAVGGDAARLARERGLVDQISTQPQMLGRLKELAGEDADNNTYRHVEVPQYLEHVHMAADRGSRRAKIGIVIAAGTIVDGEAPDGTVGSETFTELLREAGRDEHLRALVLRIDSPGGSALASDLIRSELDALQQRGIPVVVSMGSLAASGGYWIAAGADRIFATPTTITGSIGVFGILPTFDESLASVGIHSDGMDTTALAGLHRLDRPMTPQAKRLIQLSVDNVYQQFIKLVAESRELPLGRVNDIAQGHVWTGAKAEEIGLVDEIGNIENAIAAAAKLANLDRFETEYLERPRSLREQLLNDLSHNIAQLRLLGEFAGPANSNAVSWLERLLAPLAALPSPITFSDPRGLYAQCFDCDPGH